MKHDKCSRASDSRRLSGCFHAAALLVLGVSGFCLPRPAFGAQSSSAGFPAGISYVLPGAVIPTARLTWLDAGFSLNPDVRGAGYDLNGSQLVFAEGSDLVIVPPSGEEQRVTVTGLYDIARPSLSPDGLSVAVQAQESQNMQPEDLNIYAVDLATGQYRRVSSLPVNEESPEWFPHENRIAYSSFDPEAGISLHVYDLDASVEVLRVPDGGGIHLAVSSDGLRILEPGRMKIYDAREGGELADLKAGVLSSLEALGYTPDTRFPGQANRGTFPQDGDFSPDGEYIVFDGAVERDGVFGVVLCRMPVTGGGLEVLSDIIPVNPEFSNNHNFSQLNPMYRKTVSARRFTLTDRGGVAITSTEGFASVTVGSARIQPGAGNTTPFGVAIFGSRVDGVLVSEAGVPASPRVSGGRIFAEVVSPVNTGLAMANPNFESATIDFNFTDVNGVNFGAGSFSLGPNEQIARFLDEAPFNAPSGTRGTFTFTSSIPVSVTALRGLTNERSEFLITTLPVASLTSGEEDVIYLPRFVDGAGWTTRVILVNPADEKLSGTVRFFGTGSGDIPAEPVTLALTDGRIGSEFAYEIPPRASRVLQTSNPGALSQGSVRVVRDANSFSPTGMLIFSGATGEFTVTEAGVPASPARTAFRMYAEAQGVPGAIGSIRSGLAISNTASAAATVNFELSALDGVSTGWTASTVVPGSGHVAKFVDELFPALPTPFQGILRVTSTPASVAVVGLRTRTNERGEFLITTTAPADEGSVTTTGEMLFPHVVDGAGWTTQFILFSGVSGQSTEGTLRFLSQSGRPLGLGLPPE